MQVKMHPKLKEKTVFATQSGLYQFVVMAFGLCPGHFPAVDGDGIDRPGMG